MLSRTVALGLLCCIYTFVVTSRWPNLSRVSGRQDFCSLPDVQQLWVAALEEKMSAYSSYLLFSEVILKE